MAGTPTTQPGNQTKRRKRADNPAGSTNALREDVLKVLGVMKVATADQIQRAAAPHLTYRHSRYGFASLAGPGDWICSRFLAPPVGHAPGATEDVHHRRCKAGILRRHAELLR